jgi:hypothetical protein
MGSLSSAGRGEDVVFIEGPTEGGDGEEVGMDEGGVGKIPTRGVGPVIGGESSCSCIEELGMDERSGGNWGRAPPCARTWAVVSGVGGRREPRKLCGGMKTWT